MGGENKRFKVNNWEMLREYDQRSSSTKEGRRRNKNAHAEHCEDGKSFFFLQLGTVLFVPFPREESVISRDRPSLLIHIPQCSVADGIGTCAPGRLSAERSLIAAHVFTTGIRCFSAVKKKRLHPPGIESILFPPDGYI